MSIRVGIGAGAVAARIPQRAGKAAKKLVDKAKGRRRQVALVSLLGAAGFTGYQAVEPTGLVSQLEHSAEMNALLDTLAWAEGTDRDDKHQRSGYNVQFGHGTFDSYSDHPQEVISRGGLHSSAAGRYQFMGYTHDSLQEEGYFRFGFGPRAQDRAALSLVQEKRGITQRMLEEAIESRDFDPVLRRLAPEWASIPDPDRGYQSRYGGQGAISVERFETEFFDNLAHYQRNLNTVTRER